MAASLKPKGATSKKTDPHRRNDITSQSGQHDAQPWKAPVRPTCAQTPRDNSFVIEVRHACMSVNWESKMLYCMRIVKWSGVRAMGRIVAWCTATTQDDALAHTVESLLYSFCISDPLEDGNPVTFVSPGFEAVTGYPAGECIGRNCRFLQVQTESDGVWLHNSMARTMLRRSAHAMLQA